MNEYIITGLTKDNNRCLVLILGKMTKEQAKKKLEEFIKNPSEFDKRSQEGMTDFKIELVEEKDCWWAD